MKITKPQLTTPKLTTPKLTKSKIAKPNSWKRLRTLSLWLFTPVISIAIANSSLAQTGIVVQAEAYSDAHDTTSGNSGSGGGDVDTEATTDTGGGINVGWTASGEWLKYDVDLDAGTYDVTSRVASLNGGGHFSVSINGQNFADHSVATTNGWQAWRTDSLGQIFVTSSGSYEILVDINEAGFNLNWLNFEPAACNGPSCLDSDSDGVVDADDSCPNTPPNTPVDSNGCATLVTLQLTVQVEEYTDAHDTSLGNSGSGSGDVDTQTTTDTDGGLNVGWTAAGEWLEYDIILASGTYKVTSRVASLNGGGQYSLLMDGIGFASDNVPSTSGWQNWTTQNLGTVIVNSSGTHKLRINISAPGFNINWLDFQLETTNSSGELRPDSPWTYLIVSPTAKYGEREFAVPAAQNWVNTGLYLEQGQQAFISALGEWKVSGPEFYDADGHPTKTNRDCAEGVLAARIGLEHENELICIGRSGTLTASKDGIVYVGGNLSSDIGEGYDVRNARGAEGELLVTVIANTGNTVPTITVDQVSTYPFASIESEWVEILSEHTIFTLPTSIAEQDAADIPAALARIDAMYELHADLRGNVPFFGQAIRWYPDNTAPGWMLAGNPVRIDPQLVFGGSNIRITQAAEPGNDNWGFAHELGHTFSYIDGVWVYSLLLQFEAWPNIFTMQVMDKLNIPHSRQYSDSACVALKADYLAAGDFDPPVKSDTKLALCFFMELKNRYGWNFYNNFYADLNVSGFSGWQNLRARYSDAAGEDVNFIFDEWKLPQR
jgi:hypothetical protein